MEIIKGITNPTLRQTLSSKRAGGGKGGVFLVYRMFVDPPSIKSLGCGRVFFVARAVFLLVVFLYNEYVLVNN